MSEKSLAAAKVVDGVLIISLPDAEYPVVWQMELGQSKSSALEVRPQADSGFALVLKTPHQDVQNIASYATRDLAVQALLTVSRALERAQGQLKAGYAGPANHPLPVATNYDRYAAPFWAKAVRFILKCFFWLAGFVILFLLVGILTSHLLNGKGGGGVASLSPSSVQQQNVPVAADDFLEGR